MDSNMHQIVNYALSRAIPALMPVVDERVGSILGTAVSAVEAAAGRVETATRGRMYKPRRSNKRLVTLGDYDGDTEVAPTTFSGPRPTKINKQHVSFHHSIILFLHNPSFSKGPYQEVARESRCPPYKG